MTRAEIDRLLPQFEGLIFTTAVQIMEEGVELDFDDVRQLLRIKIWRAIERFDQSRTTRMDLNRFAFGCMFNMRKDIEKRPRRFNLSLDALREHEAGADQTARADQFDAHYMSVDADSVYVEVEDEAVELPATLTDIERRVIALRLDGRLLQEIDRELGLSRPQREHVLDSIRGKLDGMAPERGAPKLPLPHAEPRRTQALAA